MSPSPWEQDVLDSIKNGLADTDPGLVARLALFTRLASGEAMPVREKLQAASRQAVQRGTRRLDLSRTMLLVWLVTSLTLIAAAVVSSRTSGHLNCTGSWKPLCGNATAAAQPVP